MQRIRCDVLVIGGGGGGAMAAMRAAQCGARVALVSKGKVMRSGATVMAPGALAAVDERWKLPQDSFALHETDTLQGGAWLNDQALVRQVVEKIGGILMEMERQGAIFQRTPDGRTLDLRTEGGHSCNRSPFMGNRIGREIMRSLFGGLAKLHVPLYEGVMISELLVENGTVRGAVGFRMDTLEPVVFESAAVILATGGAGMVYARNDNATDLTGDGYALALEAGAPLMDMEFVQCYPLGFLSPAKVRGVLGAYPIFARLYNEQGERLMEKYDPRLEMATRDKVSQGIMQEVEAGRGSPLGGAWCDLSHCAPGFFETNYPGILATYKSAGIDPYKDRFELAPTCHFFMGGVMVDPNWETEITGLYSIGEAAAGVHGANRVGQNALSDILVSGWVAAEHAATRGDLAAPGTDPVAACARVTARLDGVFSLRGRLSPAAWRLRLQAIMQKGASVLRSEASLQEAGAMLDALAASSMRITSRSAYCNPEATEAVENENLLATSRCILACALARTESRGAHFRKDFPNPDDANWLKNSVVRKIGGELRVGCKPVALQYYKEEESHACKADGTAI